jgi:hypothetical protein
MMKSWKSAWKVKIGLFSQNRTLYVLYPIERKTRKSAVFGKSGPNRQKWKKRHLGKKKRHLVPKMDPKKGAREKRLSLDLKNGWNELTILGYPLKRAPDRPWAFRRVSPPLVVYRGTPFWGSFLGSETSFAPIFTFWRTFAVFRIIAYNRLNRR